MSRPTLSEVLANHPAQPALMLLTPRQGLLMSTALTALSIVLVHEIASGPALAVWATALLVISAALPCLLSVVTAVGMTGIAMLTTQAWPLPDTSHDPFELAGMGFIGLLAFGAGHCLAKLHRLRMKIAARNAKLGLKSAVLEYLAEQHGDGIVLLDKEGRMLAHNQRYRDLLGLDMQTALVGASWLETVSAEPRGELFSALERALQTGTAHCQIQIMQQRCDIDLRSLSQDEGSVSLLVGTVQAAADPGPQNAIAAGVIQFAAVAETRGEGFIACDADWHVVAANVHARREARDSGITEPLGQPIWHLFPWIPRSWCESAGQRVADERPGCRDLFDALGRRWYELTFFPWRDGIALLYRDITIARNNAARASEMAERWDMIRTSHHLGEWGFDLECSDFLFCATARLWLGLPPECERISKQQLLELVEENDRLKLVQGIIELASTPLALLNLEVRIRANNFTRETLRLHWLGRLAEGDRQVRLFGTLQRIA